MDITIYGKTTCTDTTVLWTSNHPHEHKIAAFKYYINRMIILPITEKSNKEEWKTILAIAPCSVLSHNVTCSTSQCALIVQKYAQGVRFRIAIVKCKNFSWKFFFLISISMTHVIKQIWRLIFVLKTFDFENELKSA
jgi:hypothetical protein